MLHQRLSLSQAFNDDKENYSFHVGTDGHFVVCKSKRSGKEYRIRFQGALLIFITLTHAISRNSTPSI